MFTEIATGNEIASVRIARTDKGAFEYAVSNPFGGKKLVFIISTLYGCPVGCPICDAGGAYRGVVGKDEMGEVIRNLFDEYSGEIPSRFSRLKIQFSRMGEPSFNSELPSFIDELCEKYGEVKPVLSISSVAPESSEKFFLEFMHVVERRSPDNEFQLQFSIHSTDDAERDKLIPVKKMDFRRISLIGESFHKTTGKKTVLNFALFDGVHADACKVSEFFRKDAFIIKFTPVNPTYSAKRNGIEAVRSKNEWERFKGVINTFKNTGYEIIDSPGDFKENQVMSNCGQYTMSSYERKN